MKYNFIETSDIVSDYIKKHNLDITKYNDYDFDINEEAVRIFYNKLLEYKDKKFLIVGDYDCDGICSVTIINNIFRNLGINSNYYIPSRTKEGYGLNKLIVDNATKYKYDVILLLDNGVSCKEAIDYAYDKGIKVFIIDHHKFENKPRCEAFLHQDLLSDEFKYTSAAELCFLLSLCSYFDEYNLVLAGLTVLSDYIQINSFNRYLLSVMIESLNEFNFLPLFYLNESSNYSGTSLTFNIIPKINSISRIELNDFNPNHLVKYLMSEYPNMKEIGEYISNINKHRKDETNNIFNNLINNNYEKDYIFINCEDIKEGYCSSLATKLCNYFDKPVFVLNKTDEICKGSCRCQNLDIHSLLLKYSKFISFGGHEHACGLTIKTSDIDDFMNFLDTLNFKDGKESEEDVYIIDPNLVDGQLLNDINALGPFGNGYEMPIIGFVNKNYQTLLIKDKYTKFLINDKLTAITFEEKYIDYVPKYIFGNLNRDNYHEGAYSLIIKGLI